MNLINAYPFLPLHAQLSDSIEAFIGKSVSGMVGSEGVNALPKANVIEKEDVLRIDVVAPGYKKEDFEVTVHKGLLRVRTEIRDRENAVHAKWNRREFFNKSFTRVFQLYSREDVEEINARYEKGILSIEVPKVKEITRKIEVS